MAQLPAVLLVVMLGCCGGSPVLNQPLVHPRAGDAGVHTSGPGEWRSWSASHTSSSQDSSSSDETARHTEFNAVDEVSRWESDSMDNDLWNTMVSESSDSSESSESSSEESESLYEDDSEYESPPSLTDPEVGMEITDVPRLNLLDSHHVLKYEDVSSASTEDENDSSTKEVLVWLKDETLPVGNTSEVGPEFGSEQFDEALGEALIETLDKMKTVLAAHGSGRRREEGDLGWRQGLSRLRVKRSDEEEVSSEEVSALDELPVNSLNDIVDLFVILARQALEERGLDQVGIPPLEHEFSRSLGVGTLRGFFRGDGGWVRRLTTVRRLGDVWLDRGPRPASGDPRDGRSVSVATSLGLEELMVGFERYVADVRALPTVSGRLVADIDENAVLLNISFSKKDDDPKGCDVNLLHLRVLQLNGINMKLTGLGPLNWLLSRIATWLTTHSQEKVAQVVENELIGIANKEIRRIPCDADFITALYML